MSEPSTFKDYLKLHWVVFIWGFTAILGLLIRIPSVEIVFYRTILACLLLAVFFWAKKISFRLPLDQRIRITGTGFLIAVHWILFFWAAKISNVSVCLAGMATISLWTALVEPLANKTRLSWYQIVLGCMAVLGLYIVFNFEMGYWKGLLMAILSAMVGAVFMVINGKFTKKHNPYVITFYEMVGAFVFCALFMPFYSTFLAEEGLSLIPSMMDWLWLLLLSGICTVYAFSLSVELMKRLSAFAVNLTVNLEPVYGIILAVLIFGEKERMTGGFYWGTSVLLAAVCLYPLIRYIEKRKDKAKLLRVP